MTVSKGIINSVPLADVLQCGESDLPKVLKGATVNWSGGLEMPTEKSTKYGLSQESATPLDPNTLYSFVEATGSPHDGSFVASVMCGKEGARRTNVRVDLQLRHGYPKRAEELLTQGQPDTQALLVIYRNNAALPSRKEIDNLEKRVKGEEKRKQLAKIRSLLAGGNIKSVDASRFARTDVVYLAAPVTVPESIVEEVENEQQSKRLERLREKTHTRIL